MSAFVESSNVHEIVDGADMLKFARRLFPRKHWTEALVALSAVIAGMIGSLATLVMIGMMMAGKMSLIEVNSPAKGTNESFVTVTALQFVLSQSKKVYCCSEHF